MRFASICLISGLAAGLQADPTVITFSGLVNGIDSATDPELKAEGAIPRSYQPLLSAMPNTMPVDGGSLQVTIRWEGASASSFKFNRGVRDCSGDFTEDGGISKGGVMYGSKPFSLVFDQPVTLPSLFWAYYKKAPTGALPGTISVFEKPTDTLPLKTVELVYTASKGYAWSEEKGFAGLAITKITFEPAGRALNIDDLTVASPVSGGAAEKPARSYEGGVGSDIFVSSAVAGGWNPALPPSFFHCR